MELVILAGLILLNGLFAMSEIAVVSARKARLESLSKKGDLKAREALALAENPDTFLSTVQIGITLIGILLGIYSGENVVGDLEPYLASWPIVAPYAHALATAIVLILITYFSLVFGELIPKRIGLARPESIARLAARPMRWISRLSHPFVWLLSKSTTFLMKSLGIQSETGRVTEEEIKAILHEGTEHGALEAEEQAIIERIMHLGDRNITSFMTHRTEIVWFDRTDSLESIRSKIQKERHSTYPVCERELDHIVGTVALKDLFASGGSGQIKDHIHAPALFVPENNTAYQVLEKIKSTRQHICFVVDEYGSLLGLITLKDILEAIVGDLPEEHQVDHEIVRREDGSFLVDGQIPFYDFLTYFERVEWMNEGEHDFDTLAGFILHQIERIPATGETLTWKDFSFEVVDMDRNRIDKVLVRVPV
ncbi:MAG: HlyC/CorC family transporter [Spirochaetales bacterium]|nr:HlyC/CorC family transporter [Spirochaetales bacterium]